MRFGKKNRLRLASLRRNMQDKRMDDSRIVPFAESLGGITPQGAPLGDMDIGENDPTQQLLTVLGRFQRIVARAEAGQEIWSDDCMAQLLSACEICVGQRWGDVLEAVTDTARVLQSYEDAERQRDALPFLAASYELLCLMAGDLMVDSVRPSVMSKWREHYVMEAAHLASTGIHLIQDDDTLEEPMEDDETETLIVSPSLDDEDDFAQDEPPARVVPLFTDSHPSGYDGGFEWVRDAATEVLEPVSEPQGLPVAPVESDDDVFEDDLDDDLDTPRFRLGDAPPVSAEPLNIEIPAAPSVSANDTLLAPPIAEEDPLELTEEIPVLEDPLDDFFETDNDLAEPVATLADDMDLPEADTAPATAEPVVCTEPEPQPESEEPVAETPASINPESLLATARDAFARGDIAGAKALALQVALVMAQCETTRTQQQVQTTEERLRSNACAVERARFDVRDAETLVEDTTKRVTDGENDLQEKKAGADDIQLDCECIEESITKLDEEIRALMMRRDEELAHLAETRARLETARMTQEEVAAELEQRQQAEQSARVKLENARQAVKTLTFKSTEIETALARSRDELDRRYSSVQDIEKTLEQTAPNAEAALGEGNANDDNSDTAADSASLF